MKKIIESTLFFLLTNSIVLFSQNSDCIFFNNIKNRAYHKEDTTKLYTGECMHFYKNGQLKAKCYFQNGLLISENNYDKKGQIIDSLIIKEISEETYELYAYDKKGKIKEFFQIKNGTNHGKYKRYYDNGVIEFETDYINGKKDGEERKYFKNGNIEYIRRYSNDNLINPSIEWDIKGNKYEVNYRVKKSQKLDVESLFEESRKMINDL